MHPHFLQTWIVFAVAGLLGTAPLALAQPSRGENPEDAARRGFERRDRNADGLLDGEEVPGDMRRNLTRWDSNGDGKINLIEYKRYLYMEARERFERDTWQLAQMASGKGEEFERVAANEFRDHDRDRNGLLDRREIPGRLRDDLARWDTNRDGNIDLNELKHYLRERAQGRLAVEQRRLKELDGWAVPVVVLDAVEDGPRVTVYRADHLPKEMPAWFAELDANRDAQVSLAEWLRAGWAASAFTMMDRNDDGLLTVEEVLRHEHLKVGPPAPGEGEILLVPSAPPQPDRSARSVPPAAPPPGGRPPG